MSKYNLLNTINNVEGQMATVALMTDDRIAGDVIARHVLKGKIANMYTGIILTITYMITMVVIIILGLDVTTTIMTQTLHLIRMIMFIDYITAMRVRNIPVVGVIKVIVRYYTLMFTWDMYSALRKIIYKTCERCINKRINENMVDVEKLDRKLPKWKTVKISNYWESIGLSIKKMKMNAKLVRVYAVDPIKPITENPEVMDTRKKLFENIWLHRHITNWETADMTDQMHVKSLFKRVMGERYNTDKATQLKMVKLITGLTSNMERCMVNENQAILKALGSKGTAGQFSKKSMMEDMWKNKSSEMAIELWLEMTRSVRFITMTTNNIPLELVQYMLYRKKEPLPVDENGIKVTRIMNAPNLVARVTDCKPFMPFNEALSVSRFNMMQKVGMNIFIELKMLLIYNTDYNVIFTDFADYDGTQSAVQMYACALARLKYAWLNNQDIDDMCYFEPRYYRHINRNVKSTFGITYETIGQQASGDITTTDDNCAKSEGQSQICDDALYNLAKEKGYMGKKDIMLPKTFLMSDDTARVIMKNILKSSDIEEVLVKTAKSIGWKIKEGSYEEHGMVQNGKAFFLSHSVKRRAIATSNLTYKLEFAIIVRERERAAGKWAISSELTPDESIDNIAKLASKHLTTIMTSLGNPELIISSVYMLIYLRSAINEMFGPYTWQGLQAKTIRSISLNNMVKLQLPIIFKNTTFTHIEVDEYEEECIRYQIDRINELIKRYKQTKMIRDNVNCFFYTNITNKMWDYHEVFTKLGVVMNELERSSHLRAKENHMKWWELGDNTNVNDTTTMTMGHVMTCEHLEKQDCENTSEYKVMMKCKTCWGKDNEKFDNIIKCCIEKKNINKVEGRKDRDTRDVDH